ncbi:MAG: transketolase family protein [Eubacterium sp.]|nr:transketolase family protein [Eubacterium sp.]
MSDMKATRQAYGEALAKLGGENENIVVMDADLAHATMTKFFMEKYPERFFNAGIAEANMTDMAVGLAEVGFIPFVSTFAVFGTGRNFEQIRNSVCYPKANVKLAMTHAGISVGPDGGSHESIEDIALMRVLPNMTIFCPADAAETEKALRAAVAIEGPVYIRLSRMTTRALPEQAFVPGKANCMREGKDTAIFAYGTMVERALDAAEMLKAEGIDAAVYNFHTIKPLDVETINECAAKYQQIFTVEEHSVVGGLGEAVAGVVAETGACRVKKIGVNDKFGQSAKPEELFEMYGLDAASVARQIKEVMK